MRGCQFPSLAIYIFETRFLGNSFHLPKTLSNFRFLTEKTQSKEAKEEEVFALQIDKIN